MLSKTACLTFKLEAVRARKVFYVTDRESGCEIGGNRCGKLKTMAVSRLWATTAALAIVFSSWLCADAADASTSAPQIQGEHLRIEFDRNLHSRVVGRFDGHETTMGPFVASETVSIADRRLTEFSLVSQKNDRVSDDLERENGSS